MNDRELLELAARAAGYMPNKSWSWVSDSDGFMYRVEGRTQYWNPLRDPGDALRLAVKLEMLLDLSQDETTTFDHLDYVVKAVENDKADPIAATCLAITRAAAEIGKGIKP